MPKVIDAVYENGVFKPLENVEIKEHETVISEPMLAELADALSRPLNAILLSAFFI